MVGRNLTSLSEKQSGSLQWSLLWVISYRAGEIPPRERDSSLVCTQAAMHWQTESEAARSKEVRAP